MTLKIYVIAGEASGDFLGSRLCDALLVKKPNVSVRGIGGDLMCQRGVDLFFHCDEIAVMGLIELIPHIRRVKKLIKKTIDDICAFQPDVLVTIDSSGFCNRVIDGVKARTNIPCVHYVAPPVWAWRPWRAAKLAKRIDHLMCLFPFEPPYFEVHGLQTTCVGHPVVEMDWTPNQALIDLRSDCNKKIICLLPGSRRGEVKRHLAIFAQTVKALSDVRVVVPTFEKFTSVIKAALPEALIITDPILKRQAFIQSDVALAASGTISLELAMAKTPMVIAYRVSWLTAKIVKRLVHVSSFCLINILLKKKVVPEYLQTACNPKDLTVGIAQVLRLMDDGAYAPDAQSDKLFDDVRLLLTPDGGQKPSERAAEVVLSYVSKAF